MAGADALISCWYNKKVWNAWRPETAIHEAANDGNPLTSPDPNWTALFAVPGYPDEPSGYNCYTGGFWQSARYFFGTDKHAFSLTSPGVPANRGRREPVGVPGRPGPTRGSPQSSKKPSTAGSSSASTSGRADVHGAWIGKKTAQWIDKHYFAPVD